MKFRKHMLNQKSKTFKQTEGEIKSQTQCDKDKNGKPTTQQSEPPKIQQK